MSTVYQQPIWSERWRLAALSQTDLMKIGLTSLMCGIIFLMFHLQGNTVETDKLGTSAFLWLKFRWDVSGGDFSHGYLIPIVSMWIIWYNRRAIADAPKAVSWVGLVFVIGSLLAHYVGAKAQQPRLSVMGLIGLAWSIPFYFYGWRTAKILMFPAAYLIFCIPLNFLDSLTFPLKHFVAISTASTLNGLGIAVERSGAIIQAVDGTFSFNIDDPCSGLRSLLALTAIAAVYAYFTQRTVIRKWLLFLASIPIAVLGNMARILAIGLMAQAFGQKVATGIFHDYSGYIFFPVAIGLLVAMGAFLNLNFREVRDNLVRLLKEQRHATASSESAG